MWFFRLFRSKPTAETTEETVLSEMRAVTGRLSVRAFREFTPPLRSQAGGKPSLATKRQGSMTKIGIVPNVGVKVP